MKRLDPITPLLLETNFVKGCVGSSGVMVVVGGCSPLTKDCNKISFSFFLALIYSIKHVKCIIKSVLKIIIMHNLFHFGVQNFPLALRARITYFLYYVRSCKKSHQDT